MVVSSEGRLCSTYNTARADLARSDIRNFAYTSLWSSRASPTSGPPTRTTSTSSRSNAGVVGKSTPKTVSFNQKEQREISGSKGTANFVWRCANCKKEHSANVLPSDPSPKSKSKSTAPIPYTDSDSSNLKPFISVDCRGLEFTEFHFHGRWLASPSAGEGEQGTKEFEIDWDELAREGEERWDDYDEDKGEAVSISELKSEIKRI